MSNNNEQPKIKMIDGLEKFKFITRFAMNLRVAEHGRGEVKEEKQNICWTFDGKHYIGCDNESGECFIEAFDTPEELLKWLNNEQDEEGLTESSEPLDLSAEDLDYITDSAPEKFKPTHEVTQRQQDETDLYFLQRMYAVQHDTQEVRTMIKDWMRDIEKRLAEPVKPQPTTLTEAQVNDLTVVFKDELCEFMTEAGAVFLSKKRVNEWMERNGILTDNK